MDTKVNEYAQAIQKYSTHWIYQGFEVLVSCFIVTLQVTSAFMMLLSFEHASLRGVFLILFLAYITADFVNGLVHMFMDNNTNYTSCVGPYVAAFHLHHAKAFYQVRPPLKVYFDESGTKFWLLIYLIFVVIFQFTVPLNAWLNLGLVSFGVFSSIAELSHYWCHNATEKNTLILWLQNHRILLSKEYHKAHHCSDNIQYAFLNGITDPLINLIAHYCYHGYKNHADKHTQLYMKGLQE